MSRRRQDQLGDPVDPGYLHERPSHLREPHPLSRLLDALSRSIERLEAWHDRVSFTGPLSPEEEEQDRVLGEEVMRDIQAYTTAIEAAVKADL